MDMALDKPGAAKAGPGSTSACSMTGAAPFPRSRSTWCLNPGATGWPTRPARPARRSITSPRPFLRPSRECAAPARRCASPPTGRSLWCCGRRCSARRRAASRLRSPACAACSPRSRPSNGQAEAGAMAKPRGSWPPTLPRAPLPAPFPPIPAACCCGATGPRHGSPISAPRAAMTGRTGWRPGPPARSRWRRGVVHRCISTGFR